jgi:lysozyme family protein
MKNRFIISEEEKKSILGLHESFKQTEILKEQEEVLNSNYIMAVQDFLNQTQGAKLVVDGVSGDKTEEAVRQYQSKIGAVPTDGKIGSETINKMKVKDPRNFEKFEEMIAKHGDFMEKGTHLLNKGLKALGFE